MEDVFEEYLSHHNIDVAKVGTDIKRYCENRFGICQPSFMVTTVNELFSCVKELPYHNILNVEVLKQLAKCSRIAYLKEIVEKYKKLFFTKKISELLLMANTSEIQVLTKTDAPCRIPSLTSCTKLKEDVTVSQLNGFIIEYTKGILYLRGGVCLPKCFTKGCVCIEWLIPPQLVNYAFHSACLNTEKILKLNLEYITFGRCKIQPVEGAVRSMYEAFIFVHPAYG